DCGSGYSSGGVNRASSYHDWVTKFAGAIGTRSAAVILEPDALALDCFDDARGAMLKDAVTVLEAQSGVSVYIDAGHPNWTSAATMATRLSKSGIDNAQGFALNVSNFYSTASNVEFGTALSALVNGKHFVIDTSRNANGWQGEWCNPQGAGVGAAPTATTGTPLFDAGLWIKAPGDSDGNCNGGPSAGAWWSTYALSLYNQGTH
ncbi:MAG: glycoside hydrolase family 6 protein, partial [Patescibacteria group bacterium]